MSNGRLLIVDGSPLVLASYGDALAAAGFQTAKASSGADALEQIERGEFDAVFSDVARPAMNGFVLLRRLRARSSQLPVILMLDAPDQRIAVQGMELGAVQSLVKPIGAELLAETAAYAIRLRRLQRNAPPTLPVNGNRRVGAMLLAKGVEYFNPDEAARRIRSANPGMTQGEANNVARQEGRRLLERVIREGLTFAFETTLGGRTMTALLNSADSAGIEVRIWYVGLATVELHTARVRTRVSKGGPDIPEAKIRERYDRSRLNLIELMPKLTELRVFDNSKEADPDAGVPPDPELLLHMKRGKILSSPDLAEIPEWAKPILAAAVNLER